MMIYEILSYIYLYSFIFPAIDTFVLVSNIYWLSDNLFDVISNFTLLTTWHYWWIVVIIIRGFVKVYVDPSPLVICISYTKWIPVIKHIRSFRAAEIPTIGVLRWKRFQVYLEDIKICISNNWFTSLIVSDKKFTNHRIFNSWLPTSQFFLPPSFGPS